MSNYSDRPATTLEIWFADALLNVPSDNPAFRDRAELPNLDGLEYPDSFFVAADPTMVLSWSLVDSNAMLKAGFTLWGSKPILPAQSQTTIAHLTSPVGGGCVGIKSMRAVVDGKIVNVDFFDGAGVVGCPPPVLEALPVGGSTIDFGLTASSRVLHNTVHLSASPYGFVYSTVLEGPDATLFDVVDFAPTEFGDEDKAIDFDVRFLGADQPRGYSASLTLFVSQHPIDPPEPLLHYSLKATVPVPEPTGGWLVLGLATIGFRTVSLYR